MRNTSGSGPKHTPLLVSVPPLPLPWYSSSLSPHEVLCPHPLSTSSSYVLRFGSSRLPWSSGVCGSATSVCGSGHRKPRRRWDGLGGALSHPVLLSLGVTRRKRHGKEPAWYPYTRSPPSGTGGLGTGVYRLCRCVQMYLQVGVPLTGVYRLCRCVQMCLQVGLPLVGQLRLRTIREFNRNGQDRSELDIRIVRCL